MTDTKTATAIPSQVTAQREPRPFLYLDPRRAADAVDATGRAALHEHVDAAVPALVNQLVDHTIALQNARARVAQPINVSVLNRRRRAARAWLLAVVDGAADDRTAQTFAGQWLPLLCGTGPDRGRAAASARGLVEFVRGAATAWIFEAPSASLLPNAHALHALEVTLAAHLAAAID